MSVELEVKTERYMVSEGVRIGEIKIDTHGDPYFLSFAGPSLYSHTLDNISSHLKEIKDE